MQGASSQLQSSKPPQPGRPNAASGGEPSRGGEPPRGGVVSGPRGNEQTNLPGENLPEHHFKKKYFNQVAPVL